MVSTNATMWVSSSVVARRSVFPITARRTCVAPYVDGLARLGGAEEPEGRDAVASDRNVALVSGVARAVGDPRASQDDIVAGAPRSPLPAARGGGEEQPSGHSSQCAHVLRSESG